MKRTPLNRSKPLRSNRSTGKATAAQVKRWDRMRGIGCVACRLNRYEDFRPTGMGLEIHHLISGGRRRGHDETVCLCHYHHQAKFLPADHKSYLQAAAIYGPSLEREPRVFAERYGTDDDLLAIQNELVGDRR